jgi:hypothetical protein
VQGGELAEMGTAEGAWRVKDDTPVQQWGAAKGLAEPVVSNPHGHAARRWGRLRAGTEGGAINVDMRALAGPRDRPGGYQAPDV